MITPIINATVAMSAAAHITRNRNITRNIVSSRNNKKLYINNKQQLKKGKSKHHNKMGEFIEIDVYTNLGSSSGYYSKTNININLIEEFYINNVDFMGKPVKDKSKWHYIILFNGSKKEINKESYDKIVNIFYSE